MTFESRVMALAAFAFLGAATATGTPPPPLPLPPVNWEASADTRFDPPVESVVIALTRGGERPDDDAVVGYWRTWGEGALEVLDGLADDLAWLPFTDAIRQVYFLCPLPAGRERLEQALLDRAGKDSDADISMFSHELALFVRLQGDAAIPLLAKLADHPEISVQAKSAEYLLRMGEEERQLAMNVIDQLGSQDSPEARRLAVNLLLSTKDAQAYNRAETLAQSLSADMVAVVRDERERQEGYWRAQEPMAHVSRKGRKP